MENKPESKEEDQKSSGTFVNWIGWAVVILLVYLLGTGPAVWLEEKKHFGQSVLDKIYKPVGWLYQGKLFHKPIGMYIHLWVPDVIDKNGDFNPSK